MENEKIYEAKVINNKKNSNSFLVKLLIIVCLIAIGAAGMYMIIEVMPGDTVINKLEKEVTVNENGIADAVEKVYDAVVVVETYRRNTLVATGTGVIFKQDNNKYYVMTNYHVIEDGTTIKIVLTDGNRYEVNVDGGDIYSDIAVLSFDSKEDYTIAEMGSSTDARVGDTTFTVGAPLDADTYSWTVTRGILSGKDRMIEVSTSNTLYNSNDYIMKVLQTDAAINSGNSGGPLCNSNGQVIGITSMKLVSDGVEGMGFAIPIEDAIDFANKIINGEDITRPKIGISMVALAGASIYGVDIPDNVENGVAVLSVNSGSSAEVAGLERGDIITEFDNVKIESVAQLKYELYRHNVGDVVTIKINRHGSIKDLQMTLTKGD